jgi:hypothetical protein
MSGGFIIGIGKWANYANEIDDLKTGTVSNNLFQSQRQAYFIFCDYRILS